MITTQQIKQRLTVLSHQTGKLELLEQQVAHTQALIAKIESSKAYKLKTFLTKLTKKLRIYYPLLVSKFYFKLWLLRLSHQTGPLAFFQNIGLFIKFTIQHGVTFTKLLIKNRSLFLLYFSNLMMSFREVSIEVTGKKTPKVNALVDIIIPWYGDANIIKLVLSLKTFDRKFVHAIYVINDCYPDAAKTQLLFNQLKQLNFAKLKLIANSTNLGFIGTVNRGMKLSKHDVVLLNSDTVPTNNWIDELRAACYVDKKTATATSMSNNATIFSLQKFNEPSQDRAPGETAEALAALSPMTAIKVPTAHGFCMYIKRSILNKFGYFDAKRYGKGYCEENDYSMRLHKAGYVNVAAARSYVAHLEGRSFGNKRRLEQLQKNYAKLLERYPEYHSFVIECLRTSQLRDFQKSMSFLLREWRKKREYVLLVNHSDIFSAVGGVERTTFEEITRLSNSGNKHILVFFFDDQKRHYKLMFIKNKIVKVVISFEKNSKALEIFKWIISAFKIKLVIANHLMQHSLKYFSLLKQQGIKSICLVHDYYYLFESPDLLEQAEFMVPKIAHLSQKLRKQRSSQLTQADKIIFNSEFTKEIYEHFLGKMQNAFVSYPDQLIR